MAQRLEEALSDFTLDSYKARALNSRTRTKELIGAIRGVEVGDLYRPLLRPIVEELASSISKDHAMRTLLAGRLNHFSHAPNWELKDLPALRARAEYLYAILETDYEKTLQEQLSHLVTSGREKKSIQQMTVDLATEWMQRGYSRDYVYFCTREYFFTHQTDKLDRDVTSVLQDFFSIFQDETKEWSVIVRASPDVERLRPALDPGFVDILRNDDLPDPQNERERRFVDSRDAVFLNFSKIEAKDPQSATDRALDILDTLVSFARLHDQRSDYRAHGSALVTSPGRASVVLKPRKKPIHKQPQGTGRRLIERLGPSAARMDPREMPRESFTRIYSTLRLHADALEAHTPEQQMLSLWFALESLLPLKEADSRIAKLIELTVPLLARQYPVKILSYLRRDLRRCIPQALDQALRAVPRDHSGLGRFALLVCAAEYQAARDQLFAATTANPLLRNRLYQVSEANFSADRIYNSIAAHQERVEWHLYRMYRARNQLVHEGTSITYIDTLVENLHAYVLRIIQLLEEALGDSPRPPSLDAAILKITMEHRSHLEALTKGGKTGVSSEVLDAFIFGNP